MINSSSFHDLSVEASLQQLESAPTGLSMEEAQRRLQKYGANKLPQPPAPGFLTIFLAQFKSPIVYLLLFATVASFVFKDYTEAVAILLVILVNAVIGFIMEFQATRSMEALKRLDESYVKVYRDEVLTTINSQALVPGDVIYIEGGDIVPADARIMVYNNLEVDESPLTGESLPVAKSTRNLSAATPVADRINLLFKGTAATRGNGKAVVIKTGAGTELGKIADMVSVAKQEEPPLDKRLEKFSKKLIWLVVILALPFLGVGLWQQRELHLMIETAIALAVAAIPEGLPIVATIALARGMLKLAKQQVIIKKLAAVETLGSANIVLTDKTGTLTENKLTVNQIILPKGNKLDVEWRDEGVKLQQNGQAVTGLAEVEQLVLVATLCNHAVYEQNGKEIGDPLEVALLKFGTYYQKDILQHFEIQQHKLLEIPFDSETKIMGTLHQQRDGFFVASKGSVEAVLERCTFIQEGEQVRPITNADRTSQLQHADGIANKGMKVLGYAYKKTASKAPDFIKELVFTGMTGFLDPPRKEVQKAIADCLDAGIRVVMITGDHFGTAKTISREVGLNGSDKTLPGISGQQLADWNVHDPAVATQIEQAVFFSRVTPAQKLDLVNFYQQKGYVVGMTGDGINDAPALKKADIGVAMGQRGTQVACDAADMVLKDDSFNSLVVAIKQGRAIYNNVKNFIIYLLSCNLSEIMIVAIAAFSNMALPLLPLQILFLNLVTDVFPALALGMGKGSPHLMKEKPRLVNEAIITKQNWISIMVYAFVITLSIFTIYWYARFGLHYTANHSNTIVFFSLTLAQLLHPLSLIHRDVSLFNNAIVRNMHLWLAVAFCLTLLMLVYTIPFAQHILSLVHLDPVDWLLILLSSTLPVIIIRLLKQLRLVA